MRILGFSKKWPKLTQQEFTTFRFPRKDADWQPGEKVQIVLHPRSPKREPLGIAVIVKKEIRLDGTEATNVTHEEAIEDGFIDVNDMEKWMIKTHGERRVWLKSMNKLTLQWVKRV
jgi:hypothetical protein